MCLAMSFRLVCSKQQHNMHSLCRRLSNMHRCDYLLKLHEGTVWTTKVFEWQSVRHCMPRQNFPGRNNPFMQSLRLSVLNLH